jgi:serine/threonine protein kinase
MQERLSDTKRFEREARIAARLQHPGITVVHDFGTYNGMPFIVMELQHGHDLDCELR